jgi:DNA-binding winged helix-turn-helix (wHTH) protein
VFEPVSNSQVVRFGIYELDLHPAELRKNGMRVKLTGQPFQILGILVEHPGELVTREQLQRRLWPSDTFVDFDRGLNAAINRVREALGDSAENPRFVQTIPRKGYRFVAPANGVNGLSPGAREADRAEPRRKAHACPEHPVAIEVLRYVVSAVLILVLITAVAWWHNSNKVPQITRYSQITADGQGKSSGYASEPPPPLISDGARLYFMEGPVGTKHLVQVSAQGGETSLLLSSVRIRRV